MDASAPDNSPAEQQAQQAAAAEEAAFGGDLYADLPAGEGQQAAAAAGAAALPPGGVLVGGGEPDADDLYGDLGPVVPQVDGAADSPPRRARHRGADPGERWELGRDGERWAGAQCSAACPVDCGTLAEAAGGCLAFKGLAALQRRVAHRLQSHMEACLTAPLPHAPRCRRVACRG